MKLLWEVQIRNRTSLRRWGIYRTKRRAFGVAQELGAFCKELHEYVIVTGGTVEFFPQNRRSFIDSFFFELYKGRGENLKPCEFYFHNSPLMPIEKYQKYYKNRRKNLF